MRIHSGLSVSATKHGRNGSQIAFFFAPSLPPLQKSGTLNREGNHSTTDNRSNPGDFLFFDRLITEAMRCFQAEYGVVSALQGLPTRSAECTQGQVIGSCKERYQNESRDGASIVRETEKVVTNPYVFLGRTIYVIEPRPPPQVYALPKGGVKHTEKTAPYSDVIDRACDKRAAQQNECWIRSSEADPGQDVGVRPGEVEDQNCGR